MTYIKQWVEIGGQLYPEYGIDDEDLEFIAEQKEYEKTLTPDDYTPPEEYQKYIEQLADNDFLNF